MQYKHERIIELSLALFFTPSISIKFYSYAMQTAIYLLNKLPTKVLNGLSPFKVLCQKDTEITTLETYQCFPCLGAHTKHKLEP